MLRPAGPIPIVLLLVVALARPGAGADPPASQPERPPATTRPARDPGIGPDRTPDRPANPRATLRSIVVDLERAYDEARADGAGLPRARVVAPDDLATPLSPEIVFARLARPAPRRAADPARDAYVRWQLTAMIETLPDLDDRAWEKLLAGLPAYVPNPRADRALIQRLQRIRAAGTMSDDDRAILDTQLDELAERESAARRLNRAADGLRAWLMTHAPQRGPRQLQLQVERCGALVAAGWPPRRLKEEIERTCTERRRDPAFSEAMRRRVMQQAERLTGRTRMYVSRAGVNEEGQLELDLADAAVYDFEVRRWARELGWRP